LAIFQLLKVVIAIKEVDLFFGIVIL